LQTFCDIILSASIYYAKLFPYFYGHYRRHSVLLSTTSWLWLFPMTYLVHIAEEYWGGEGYSAYLFRLRGVHLSPADFWAVQTMALHWSVAGVVISRN